MRELQTMLDQRPDLQNYLFRRGFLITNREPDLTVYPFYNNWIKTDLTNGFAAYVHRDQKVTVHRDDSKCYVLIGHAYDPFCMEFAEKKLIQKLANNEKWYTAIENWTGIYCIGRIDETGIAFTTDAAGQQLVYYGIIDNKVFITSHSQLVGELENLIQDPYVVRLSAYRYFHAFGLVLPGDLSPFRELKRAQCNFLTRIKDSKIDVERIWPICSMDNYKCENADIGHVLHNTMKLIANKWPNKKAAISVTGGMDSKTTLACANGLYDSFQYFSYDSLPDEKVDALAASKLCQLISLPHKIYTIPKSDEDIPDFDVWKLITFYNCGCIGFCNSNDIRKRAYFSKIHDFEIEVKSWVDEIGRARYHKRFNKSRFPKKPTARYLSTLYKPFLLQRKLLHETDKVFSEYLNKYYDKETLNLIPWWDLVYWEFEWNAAEGAFLTGDHRNCYEITIPYNNRRLLAMMLSQPLNERINDSIQKEIIHIMNPEIEETGIHVQDVSHTKTRAMVERIYLEVNSHLPF